MQLLSADFMRIGTFDEVHKARFAGPIVVKYELVAFNNVSFSAAIKSL